MTNLTENQKTDFQIPATEPGQRIGLFGGSFNPPHEGHLLVAKTAIERLNLDTLWWMITPGNPIKDKSELLSLEERINASRHLIANDKHTHDHSKIIVTAFETELHTTYSAQVIDKLCTLYPSVYFAWIMGADNLASFHLWHEWRDICKSVPIAVIDRPDKEKAAISSPFAQDYLYARRDEAQAKDLIEIKPPAWVYIHGPLSHLSSTELRQKNLHK